MDKTTKELDNRVKYNAARREKIKTDPIYAKRVRELKIESYHRHKDKSKVRLLEYRNSNREHVNEIASNSWNRCKDRIRFSRMLRLFGITREGYNELREKQSNTCAICKQPETAVDKRLGEVRKLAIDHDHITNKVRGLLCTNCNLGLGKFRDNPNLLIQAYQYLKDNN